MDGKVTTTATTTAAPGKLVVRPAPDCRFDVVSLGEVMLRLDPGEGRVHTTRTFQAWEGGGSSYMSWPW